MRTFSVQTLGCKVNHYESEQLIALLRQRGLVQVQDPRRAHLRIINTCSVTVEAASKSRQAVRRAVRLPVLSDQGCDVSSDAASRSIATITQGLCAGGRVIVTGCWATSDRAQAQALGGVDAVLTHHDCVRDELDRLLKLWNHQDQHPEQRPNGVAVGPPPDSQQHVSTPEPVWYDRTNDNGAGTPARSRATDNKPPAQQSVKQKLPLFGTGSGTRHLPLLGERYTGQQRAFLKIQDGCDAHCTYCIIPQLRPSLWSKSIDDAVDEAQRLVDAGHVEIVLTGIFLGAYGQETALRRRQGSDTATPLGKLVDALCTRVAKLRRLRLSSLEPGDLTPQLIDVLRSHEQVVPHFHLPLQSGSDRLLRRMNRQYARDEFLEMVDRVCTAFDRPAITTDIIVGFPGETGHEFAQTLDVVERVRFIHTHAFPYSPRPGTAAARWVSDRTHGSLVNQRIQQLQERARVHCLEYRRQFLGQVVQVMVERNRTTHAAADAAALRHGRSERYFDVHFESTTVSPGELVRLRIERVTPQRTWGRPI